MGLNCLVCPWGHSLGLSLLFKFKVGGLLSRFVVGSQ